MNNPFIRASIHSSNQAMKVKKNQDMSNRVSTEYFHNQVRDVEHPLYLKTITTILEKQAKTPPVSEEYISKLLFNKEQLSERAKMMMEENQSMLFNRKIPALTATKIAERLPPEVIHRAYNIHSGAKMREKRAAEKRLKEAQKYFYSKYPDEEGEMITDFLESKPKAASKRTSKPKKSSIDQVKSSVRV